MWRSLQVKFLLTVVPLFVLASAVGLSWLAEYDTRKNLDGLAARVGNHAARVAAVVGRPGVLEDEAIASRVLATLLADGAVQCAEVDVARPAPRRVLAPRGIGCLGQEPGERLELALDGLEHATLVVRFSTREIDEARTTRREFSLLVTALGFALAVGCSAVGFHWTVGLPLRRLLAAIHETSASGRFGLVGRVGTDEIGRVTEAFNAMQIGLRSRSERLSHMARHDALTGLANRVLLHEHMEGVLARLRPGGGGAVLCLDLDGFKGVNDTLGHPAGDELLRLVARRLRDNTRETDLVARLGGDEFAVVQADAGQPADATVLAERLVEALRAPFDLRGQQAVIGTSVGVALADGAATADELLRSADIALYRAKAGGRGTWRVFEAGMDAGMQARRALEADLRRALAERQFELFYQPLVEARTQALTGFEALLRWRHPERGMVPPAEFIPVAEEIGLIRPLGAWVLTRTCADAAAWPEHVKVAVNLSPAQFVGGDLVREVERALRVCGLPAGRLELEVTESVLLQDDDATLGVLHRLHALGVRISMDDFGTGYSSLSYLRRFPFDEIKIDQSFVHNLERERGGIEIIRAVVGLGKALGMDVLAEGVETAEQFGILRGEGCDELQGHLFGKPRPVQDVQGIIVGHLAAKDGATRGPTLVIDNSGGGQTAA